VKCVKSVNDDEVIDYFDDDV